MRKCTSKHSGFTILELLATLGMIGILVAVGVPAMSDWTQRAQVRSETQKYTGILNLARSTAINTNQVVTIAIAEADADGSVDIDIFIDDDGAGNEAFAGDPDQYVRRFEGEASALDFTLTPEVDFISFDGSGRLMGGAALQIDIANVNENLGRVIDINLVGRTSVTEKEFD